MKARSVLARPVALLALLHLAAGGELQNGVCVPFDEHVASTQGAEVRLSGDAVLAAPDLELADAFLLSGQ